MYVVMINRYVLFSYVFVKIFIDSEQQLNV